MDADRLARVADALSRPDGVPPIDGLLELCIELLDLSGATIAVVVNGEHLGSFATVGESAAAIDELQFSLGEGPCITADGSPGPVLEPDLASAAGRWPAFSPAALTHGAAAAFAFPLRVGAARLGVLTLYRSVPGDLDHGGLIDALDLARVATHVLLDVEGDLPPGTLPAHLSEVLDHRAVVHQATGMVAVQLGSDVRTALGRLRAFAWSRDRSLVDVAGDVVARALRFEDI